MNMMDTLASTFLKQMTPEKVAAISAKVMEQEKVSEFIALVKALADRQERMEKNLERLAALIDTAHNQSNYATAPLHHGNMVAKTVVHADADNSNL